MKKGSDFMAEVHLKNGKTLLIRRAIPDDAGALLAYLKIVGSESDNLLFGAEGVAFTLEQERDLLSRMHDSPSDWFLLGIVDGDIVATAGIYGNTKERTRHVGSFALAVRKPFWNAGVGTAMGKEVIRLTKESGLIRVVHLTVRTENIHAKRLYENLGFRLVGILHRDLLIRGEYADTAQMELLF